MADQGPPARLPRLSRTCNLCKERKVRCIVVAGASSCASCIKRKVPCHFSKTRRAVKQHQSEASGASTSPGVETSQPVSTKTEQATLNSPSEAFIDQILQDPSLAGVQPVNDAESVFKIHGHRLTSSNLAYFSEGHICLISQRLGHNKLLDLIRNISKVVNDTHSRASEGTTPSASPEIPVSEARLRAYVEAYFEHVHPLYPFLNRGTFEANFLDPETRNARPAFRALYHSVLALGCQYVPGDGSFILGKGEAWSYFRVSLTLLQDVLHPPEALVNLQAITVMAIFSSNTASMGIGDFLIMEAARMALSLGYHRPMANSKEDEATCYRAFWVIYLLEKGISFMHGRSSLIADHDVSCPIAPTDEERLKVDFDMFVLALRLARLHSKAYERLFSVSANLNSTDAYEMNIDSMKAELEAWRCSVPEEARPGSPVSGPQIAEGCLRLHYAYYDLSIALGRLALYVGRKATKTEEQKARIKMAEKDLQESSRAVAYLTLYIDIRPYTPLWMLAALPLSAMFLLFDMVIQRPTHQETEIDLALLDTLAGYFSRFDYATGGSAPCSLFSGFAYIANQFVRDQGTRSILPAAELSEMQDAAHESQGADFASRHDLSAVDSATEDSNLISQEYPPRAESSSYPVLDEASAFDPQLFAGFDFANLFDVNVNGHNVPGFGRPWN